MHKRNIESLMAWLRQTLPESANAITPCNLFAAALETCGQGESPLHALEDFDRDGTVPDYVDRYIRKFIFPVMRFARRRKQPKPKGGVTCTSEQRL